MPSFIKISSGVLAALKVCLFLYLLLFSTWEVRAIAQPVNSQSVLCMLNVTFLCWNCHLITIIKLFPAGVCSRECPGVWVLARSRVYHLKETPTPGLICLIWTFVWFCWSLFDFCAIYFPTKAPFVYLLLEEFKVWKPQKSKF